MNVIYPFISTVFLLMTATSAAATPREVASQRGANLQRPQWSKDGTQLSYEANYHEAKRIETYVARYGSEPFVSIRPQSRASSGLTSGFQKAASTSQVVHELCWSPAPLNQYVVSASNALGDYDLYFKNSPYAGNHPSADGGCSWSPNGRYIVFTSARSGGGDLYLIDTEHVDASPKQITNTPLAAEVYPTWSGDSKSLVYVTHTNDGDHLWWLPSIMHTPIRLTRGGTSQTRPQFSPTGNRVAFYQRNEAGAGVDLCILEIGSPADPKCIVTDVIPNTTGPTWSANGAFIVYTKNDDATFDPIEAIETQRPFTRHTLPVQTVGHGDVAVRRTASGQWRLAYIAQGTSGDSERSFKKLYVATVPIPNP